MRMPKREWRKGSGIYLDDSADSPTYTGDHDMLNTSESVRGEIRRERGNRAATVLGGMRIPSPG